MVVVSLLLPILNAPLAALQEFEIVDLTRTGAMVLNWFVLLVAKGRVRQTVRLLARLRSQGHGTYAAFHVALQKAGKGDWGLALTDKKSGKNRKSHNLFWGLLTNNHLL